jgi:hypothetical protein
LAPILTIIAGRKDRSAASCSMDAPTLCLRPRRQTGEVIKRRNFNDRRTKRRIA